MFPSLLCSKLCNDFCFPQNKSHILVMTQKNLYGLLAPFPTLLTLPLTTSTFARSAPATMHSFYAATLAPLALCLWCSLCPCTTCCFTFYHWSLPDYPTENFPPPNPTIPPLSFLIFICTIIALWPSTYFYIFCFFICFPSLQCKPHSSPPK